MLSPTTTTTTAKSKKGNNTHTERRITVVNLADRQQQEPLIKQKTTRKKGRCIKSKLEETPHWYPQCGGRETWVGKTKWPQGLLGKFRFYAWVRPIIHNPLSNPIRTDCAKRYWNKQSVWCLRNENWHQVDTQLDYEKSWEREKTAGAGNSVELQKVQQ